MCIWHGKTYATQIKCRWRLDRVKNRTVFDKSAVVNQKYKLQIWSTFLAKSEWDRFVFHECSYSGLEWQILNPDQIISVKVKWSKNKSNKMESPIYEKNVACAVYRVDTYRRTAGSKGRTAFSSSWNKEKIVLKTVTSVPEGVESLRNICAIVPSLIYESRGILKNRVGLHLHEHRELRNCAFSLEARRAMRQKTHDKEWWSKNFVGRSVN